VRRLDPNWPTWQPLAYGPDFSAHAIKTPVALRPALTAAQSAPDHLKPFLLVGLGTRFADAHRWQQLQGRPYPALQAGFPGSQLSQRCSQEAIQLSDADMGWYSLGVGQVVSSVQAGEARIVRDLVERGRAARIGPYQPVREGFKWLEAWPKRGQAALALGMGFKVGLRSSPYEKIFDPILAGLSRFPRERATEFFLRPGSRVSVAFLREHLLAAARTGTQADPAPGSPSAVPSSPGRARGRSFPPLGVSLGGEPASNLRRGLNRTWL
jgi:hypothetical protein